MACLKALESNLSSAVACLKIHWYKFDKLSKQKNWLKSRFFCFFIGKMSATIDRSSWPHGPSRRGFLLCQNSKQTHKQGRSRTGNYQFIYPTLISWILLTFYLWLQQPKRTVTGTDADLRKLPLKEARAILRLVDLT